MEVVVVLTVIVILLAPVALGYAIGWVMRGRRDGRGIVEGEGRQSRQVQKIERQDRGGPERHVVASERPWLVRELDRAPFTNVLTPKQRLDLKVHYAFEADASPAPQSKSIHRSPRSIAGMLAIEAWQRQDPARGVVVSAIAMLALLMEIAAREPVNVQAYTVPLAIYLFGLVRCGLGQTPVSTRCGICRSESVQPS